MTNGASAKTEGAIQLTLLGGFGLTRGDELLHLSQGEARVLAFLAVQNRPLSRGFVAGNLWLDSSDGHASGNLRTTLWRLRVLDERLVDSSRRQLALAAEVDVDLHRAMARARALLRNEHVPPGPDDPVRFADDLLPDWYDDWVLVERERFRQLRLRGLEALCEDFTQAGEHGLALEAGLSCVAAEPLRESAHRALMRVHLAEGNQAEALRQFRLYSELVDRELGLVPSIRMREMVEALCVVTQS